MRRVKIPEVLPLNPPLTTRQLIDQINSYGDVRTFAAQGTIHFRNYLTGKDAQAEDFPAGNYIIRLQRPELIRLRVTAPVINSTVADMVSDGRQFRLAVHRPSESRRYVKGSNLRAFDVMDRQDIQEADDPQLSRAGGLVNMRPQHLTEAFLIKPVAIDGTLRYFREEAREVEPDTRANRQGRTVEKSYYILYAVETAVDGTIELHRKFWFDRTQRGTPLVRQQTFESGDGKVGSDVSYSSWFDAGASRLWPSRVVVLRRNDGYSVELILSRSSVEFNLDLPETTFVLENTEGFEEIDLDQPRKASTRGNSIP